jgi:hypothetical protein
MRSTINFMDANYQKIKQMRVQNENSMHLKFLSKWEIDTTKVSQFSFLGFEAGYKKSEVTTGNRLYYDRSRPYKKDIRYLKEYKSVKEITIPTAYIIPKAFWNIMDLLKATKSHLRG